MRIKCQIRVITNNDIKKCVATGSQSAEAILFLAKSTFGVVLLVYCTAKDKQEIKHKVMGNVKHFARRYFHQGKTAIQLCNPPITIFVSDAQPSELKLLLKTVKLAMRGYPLESKDILSYILPPQTQHVSSTYKMIVLSRQDYRFVFGFPTTLKSLTLSHCGLSCIDSRIATLKSLVELNLSSNNIQEISEALSGLNQLLVLDLSRNEIEHLPSFAFLQNSKLTILDLSHNKLKELPNSICDLVGLCHLNISFNRLRCLPRHIHQLRCLRALQANQNNLFYLPVSFLRLPPVCYRYIDSDGIDFSRSYNAVLNKKFWNIIYNNKVLSLKQLCGKVIRNKNLFYDIDVLPYPLLRYLNNALPCQCQSYCFEDNVTYLHINMIMQHHYETKTSVQVGYISKYISFEVGLCSSKCLTLWQRYLPMFGNF